MTTTQDTSQGLEPQAPAARGGDPGSASDSRAWLIVAAREIVVRVTNRAFIVSTVLTLVLIAGFGAFSVWQGNRTSTYTVAVTSAEAGSLVAEAGAGAASGRGQDRDRVAHRRR